MGSGRGATGALLAVSDLHVSREDNRRIVERLKPNSPGDWLLVAGDVAEQIDDVAWALGMLRDRFATVVWAPGNHELWTAERDPVQLRGEQRYQRLVEVCRKVGVLTPEDPYPVWEGEGGPVTVAPLFVGYDYSFLPPGTTTSRQALARAYQAGVICTDETLLYPDPYPSRAAWCRERLARTQRRLAERDPQLPTVLVNHFPLVSQPTQVLWYPEFSLWCGTTGTADWHLRFNATAVVYGHLHIPRTTWYDGVRFEEVSLGYPHERRRRGNPPYTARQILPYR